MRRSTRRTTWCIAALGALLLALGVAPPVAAQEYVGTPPPDAGAVDSGGSGGGAVAARQGGGGSGTGHATRRAGDLALTGTDVLSLVFLGAVLIGAGVILARRKHSSVP